jgi:hypothetical protein
VAGHHQAPYRKIEPLHHLPLTTPPLLRLFPGSNRRRSAIVAGACRQLAAIAEPNGVPWPTTPSAPPQKLNIAAPPPPHADPDAPLSSVESRLRHAPVGAPTTGAARLRGQEATGHLTPSHDRLRVSLDALVLVPSSAAAAGDPTSPEPLVQPPLPTAGGRRKPPAPSLSQCLSV